MTTEAGTFSCCKSAIPGMLCNKPANRIRYILPGNDVQKLKSRSGERSVGVAYNPMDAVRVSTEFMEGVEKTGNRAINCSALAISAAKKKEEWDRIYEQTDQSVAWRSVTGAPNNGRVR